MKPTQKKDKKKGRGSRTTAQQNALLALLAAIIPSDLKDTTLGREFARLIGVTNRRLLTKAAAISQRTEDAGYWDQFPWLTLSVMKVELITEI